MEDPSSNITYLLSTEGTPEVSNIDRDEAVFYKYLFHISLLPHEM